MVIDQRNAGGSVSTSGGGAYVPDRWNIVENSDGTGTAQQVTDAPAGFNYSFKVTTGTPDTDLGTTQYLRLLHNIEGYNVAHLNWGTSAAQDVTLSFWVKSSLTGTFGCSISNSARNRSYPFTYTISSADIWEQKTITIPADTTGTWLADNGIGLRVYFGLGYGTTYAGTAGSWASTRYESATGGVSVIGTAGATWQITGVQLEVGSVATPFEHRSYGEELALCQRYYQSSYNTGVSPGSSVDDFAGNNGGQGVYHAFGTNVSGGVASSIGSFVTQMRTRPTVTVYDHSGNSGKITTFDSGSSPTANQSYNAVRQSQRQIIVRTYQSSIFGFEYLYEADAEL
jgi:hypothetical protein